MKNNLDDSVAFWVIWCLCLFPLFLMNRDSYIRRPNVGMLVSTIGASY